MKKLHILTLLLALQSVIFLAGCGSSDSKIETDDPEKAFQLSKRSFDNADYLDAIDNFSFIKVKFPGSSISDKVQFYLAESYYFRKEYLLGAYEYETLLKNYPLSPYVPDAKFRLGLCYFELSPKFSLDQEFTRYAMSELITFIDQYPNSKNVPEAQRKLESLRNKLAFRDYFIGENYLKTDNYRSAAIYFQNVYDNYIDSDYADDAMLGHAEALINGKKYDDAKLVLDKYYKLFPKSNLKQKADQLKRSIPAK